MRLFAPVWVCRSANRRGFTLVEMMTATALMLILMAILTGTFARITDTVNNSRSTIEMNSQLGAVAFRLQKDLEGYTVRPDPLRNDFTDGYLEVIEGPIGPHFWVFNRRTALTSATTDPTTFNINNGVDSTLADLDDVLMLTTRSQSDPFVSKSPSPLVDSTTLSDVAEVAWFVRGTTLYRRTLAVGNPSQFVQNNPQIREREIDAAGVISNQVVGTGSQVANNVSWIQANGIVVIRRNNPASSSSPGPLYASFPHNTTPVWNPSQSGFYGAADLSVRLEGSANDLDATARNIPPEPVSLRLVPNTLADLARREYRFAHQPFLYPHEVRFWGPLGLPTLEECSHANFPFPIPTTVTSGVVPVPGVSTNGRWANALGYVSGAAQFDARNPAPGVNNKYQYPYANLNQTAANGTIGTLNIYRAASANTRINEDVILTNVIGFDVKVWDPGAPIYAGATDVIAPGDPLYLSQIGTSTPISYGAYVDLGYAPGYVAATAAAGALPIPKPHFNSRGQGIHDLGAALPRVWDSWTSFYEADGRNQDGDATIDEATNGFDDNAFGGPDDITEREAPPPYASPLRGLQITLRIFDPDTLQVREVMVRQDFILE